MRVEAWAIRLRDTPSRSEAIRRLIEMGLASVSAAKPTQQEICRQGSRTGWCDGRLPERPIRTGRCPRETQAPAAKGAARISRDANRSTKGEGAIAQAMTPRSNVRPHQRDGCEAQWRQGIPIGHKRPDGLVNEGGILRIRETAFGRRGVRLSFRRSRSCDHRRGQTLVPMMAMRLARPTRLVDIAHIPELHGIRDDGDAIAIGAATQQVTTANDALVARKAPLLAAALPWVGHASMRSNA